MIEDDEYKAEIEAQIRRIAQRLREERVKLLKNRDNLIDLFGGGIEEHRPLTGFQPDRIDPKG
jgi:hypothetical protein